LVSDLCNGLSYSDRVEVAVAPPTIYLEQAKSIILKGPLSLGAQNVDTNLSGAFTGDVSAGMLKDIGVQYVIIGHSERRLYHKETNKLIAKKFAILNIVGLTPVLCIGETQEENEAGKTEEVCINQINAVIEDQGIGALKNSVIAYEPIWAIGTGKSATPCQAQIVHQFIRQYIAKKDKDVAESVRIQYGGSVNATNAADFFAQSDIDGALVGGASLQHGSFMGIIEAALSG
jgi:triosephosphate isomerase